METKKYLLCFVVLFLVSLLGAQEYYFKRIDGETRFIQRLSWQEGVNVWRYEVVIEKLIRNDEPPESGESFRGDESSGSSESFWGDEPPGGSASFWGDEPPGSSASFWGDEPPGSSASLESDESWESDESLESGDLPVNDNLLVDGVLLISDESLEGNELPGSGELSWGDATSGADTLSRTDAAKDAGTETEQALEESGTFTEVLREFTEDAFIEVSLPPGMYRYRVTAYDFLDRPGIPSEWARLRVFQALEPEVQDFSPRIFYVDGDAPWVLNLTGRNISPDAEVYLKHLGKNWSIVPREYSSETSLSDARLVFDVQQLVPGNYEIYVKNPGGLDTRTGTFEVGFHESYDIYIGAAYTPLLPIYGRMEQFDTHALSPLGAAVRVGFIPFKTIFGHLGLELTGSWNYFVSGTGENKTSLHTGGAELNILYQKWLSNRIMAFNFRAGAGLVGTTDMLCLQAETGVSFLWLIRKPFFVEAGIDGVHWFVKNIRSPGYLRPWLGGGIKLNVPKARQ